MKTLLEKCHKFYVLSQTIENRWRHGDDLETSDVYINALADDDEMDEEKDDKMDSTKK